VTAHSGPRRRHLSAQIWPFSTVWTIEAHIKTESNWQVPGSILGLETGHFDKLFNFVHQYFDKYHTDYCGRRYYPYTVY